MGACLSTTSWFLKRSRCFFFFGSRKLRGERESASAHGQRVRWCLIPFECNMTSFCSRIDISGEFSFTHLLEFSKLAVSFAIELGGWTE